MTGINMNKQLKRLLLLILVSGINVSAFAEVVYVSDTLRVGVRPEPDNGYSPVGVVLTGMKLNVLDRQNNYLKIETDEGITGWMKDIYVIEQKTAILKLQELQKNHISASQQLKTNQENIKQLQSSNASLNTQVDNLKEERSKLQQVQAEFTSSQQTAKSRWYWWVVVILMAIAGSFFAGIQWHQYQIMKRLGGLKV